MSISFSKSNPNSILTLISFLLSFLVFVNSRTLRFNSTSQLHSDESQVYLWPLPSEFTFGNETLLIDPGLSLAVGGNGGGSVIVKEAFERYRGIIFKHTSSNLSVFGGRSRILYDISKLTIIVHSDDQELRLGVDETYSLLVGKSNGLSIVGQVTIEANSVYGALRGLETFSQLCAFDYGTKTVQVYKAPWYILDKPKFVYRGLMLDTSRHYLPIDVIKHVIESMSYAKLNVLHWHIIDEESFPLEVPTYPNLWRGAYSKWERYTVEDAYEIVNFAKARGINVMAEIDVPGHAESWGAGYPNLWPSPTCREPLDVSKNSTFDVVSGILTDMRKIFPFELFHLGGDEVHTDKQQLYHQIYKLLDLYTTREAMVIVELSNRKRATSIRFRTWLEENNMTAKEAYQYFVLRAQEIAISKDWAPVNWEETFNTFADKLNPRTVVHNWLGSGVCPKAVAKGFRCIYSNQGVWYLDHLDIPWDGFYNADPLEGISDVSEQALVLGGEVCMWSETVDASNVQQTIWPRAAAAAERLWSNTAKVTYSGNTTSTVLPRYQYFRCLLTRRGVQAAPATNYYARRAPTGPGSCYEQ